MFPQTAVNSLGKIAVESMKRIQEKVQPHQLWEPLWGVVPILLAESEPSF